MAKITAKKVVSIEDGVHEGTVTRVEQRTEPYEYTDVYVEESDSGVELKAGAPTAISVDAEGKPKSKLAKILVQLGVEIKDGEEIDTDVVLGKKVKFQTITESTANGDFARIVPESLKLVK
jgi:hypothetical protein